MRGLPAPARCLTGRAGQGRRGSGTRRRLRDRYRRPVLITSPYLLPLLIAQPGGLLVEVTDGTTVTNASWSRTSVFYAWPKPP